MLSGILISGENISYTIFGCYSSFIYYTKKHVECDYKNKPRVYKQLKAVSRQPLTNFVNLKSNTIMKKPRCKYMNSCNTVQDF